MIAAALLLLQLAAAPASVAAGADLEAPITVRAGGRAVDIPVAVRGGAAVVRADVLALALGGRLRRDDASRFTLEVGDLELGFTAGVPFARRDAEGVPLASAPYLADDRLFLPVQALSEVLPRLTATLRYDAGRRELRQVAPGTPADAATEAAPAAPAPAPETPAAAPVRRATERTVVIDAGHGGPDRGMSGTARGGARLYEKEITLAVARRFADVLRGRGIKVVMTRTTDTLIALTDRGRIANRASGDLFVSIHVNAANPRWKNASAARGYETYFLADAKTEDARRVAELENASERFESGAETSSSDPLRFIVTDMQQNEHLRESSELAAIVQTHLGRVHDGPNRGVKQAGFRVLVTAFMPAVLVELGFGTNPSEAAMLKDETRQQRMAEALADATEDYFRRFEPQLESARP